MNRQSQSGDPEQATHKFAEANPQNPDTHLPDQQTQKQAADENPIRYSPGNDDVVASGETDTTPVSTKPSKTYTPTGMTAKGNEESLDDAQATGATGKGFTTGGKYPGPGTATDRGYGNVGVPDFGTGPGASGLGGDDSLHGMSDLEQVRGVRTGDSASTAPDSYRGAGDADSAPAATGDTSELGSANRD